MFDANRLYTYLIFLMFFFIHFFKGQNSRFVFSGIFQEILGIIQAKNEIYERNVKLIKQSSARKMNE